MTRLDGGGRDRPCGAQPYTASPTSCDHPLLPAARPPPANSTADRQLADTPSASPADVRLILERPWPANIDSSPRPPSPPGPRHRRRGTRHQSGQPHRRSRHRPRSGGRHPPAATSSLSAPLRCPPVNPLIDRPRGHDVIVVARRGARATGPRPWVRAMDLGDARRPASPRPIAPDTLAAERVDRRVCQPPAGGTRNCGD